METPDALNAFIKKNDDRAQKYLNLVEEMMGDYDSYGWAESTLIGIYDWIMEHNSVTDKQIQAIENIQKGGQENRYRRR